MLTWQWPLVAVWIMTLPCCDDFINTHKTFKVVGCAGWVGQQQCVRIHIAVLIPSLLLQYKSVTQLLNSYTAVFALWDTHFIQFVLAATNAITVFNLTLLSADKRLFIHHLILILQMQFLHFIIYWNVLISSLTCDYLCLNKHCNSSMVYMVCKAFYFCL